MSLKIVLLTKAHHPPRLPAALGALAALSLANSLQPLPQLALPVALLALLVVLAFLNRALAEVGLLPLVALVAQVLPGRLTLAPVLGHRHNRGSLSREVNHSLAELGLEVSRAISRPASAVNPLPFPLVAKAALHPLRVDRRSVAHRAIDRGPRTSVGQHFDELF